MINGLGTLYGVGVGPGASDLMTLRAVRLLNTVPVLAIPKAGKFSKSFAWRIAEPNIDNKIEQERLFQNFPMTKDPKILLPAWQVAVDELLERLKAGNDVAFLTQGDPSVYSTFIYIQEMILDQLQGAKIEVVPAVTSISAVPAVAGVPLVDGQETLVVLPATYDAQKLRRVIEEFDTIVLMKVGSVVSQIRAILEDYNLVDHAYFCERATTEDQRLIKDIRTIKEDRCAYFSMIVICKKTNSGLLSGKASLKQAY